MASEWPIARLGDLANEMTVGYVGTMADQYAESGVLFLRSLNIRPFALDLAEVKYIPAEFHARIRKSSLEAGDVVIVRTGRPGTSAVIPEGLGTLNCSDLVIVRCGPKLRPHYACYWINAMAGDHVSAHSVGAVQQHFNVSSAKLIPIPVPSLDEQDRILGVLRSLDDRIDLLRRTNATLEAIAKAMFKSWFVDFDPVRAKAEGREPEGMDAETGALFPSEFEESELGLIPKGWRVASFAETVNVIGGGTPKTTVPDYWGGEIPWFSVVDAPANGQVFTLTTEKSVTRQGIENSSARVLPAWTTIISARGTVGKLAMTAVPMAMNQSCYGMAPRVSGTEPLVYLAAQRLVDQLKRLAHGGVFDTITRDTLASILVVEPPVEAQLALADRLRPLFSRVQCNVSQTAELSEIRDTLLPRLISGKLRLPEAESVIEEFLA